MRTALRAVEVLAAAPLSPPADASRLVVHGHSEMTGYSGEMSTYFRGKPHRWTWWDLGCRLPACGA